MHSALHHDRTYMGANMVYRHNRDRVITMGFELHDKARAVHSSRPEFSLTYPNMKKPPSLQVSEQGGWGQCGTPCTRGLGGSPGRQGDGENQDLVAQGRT